jgi:ribosomal protein S18 acetylase RimI-like enzyme
MTAVVPALPALALALLPDPFYQAITVDHSSDMAKLRLLERYFEYSLLEAQRTGRCVIAQNPEHGAAAWLLPRDEEADALESEAKLAFMERLLSPAGFHNYRSILSFMSSLAARHVAEAAWYLSIIGVHPSAQGRGIGQELLTSTLSEADEKQATCYLETFMPRSIGFYMRLGFKSAACYEEPTTRSTYVLMRRDAQDAPAGDAR